MATPGADAPASESGDPTRDNIWAEGEVQSGGKRGGREGKEEGERRRKGREGEHT